MRAIALRAALAATARRRDVLRSGEHFDFDGLGAFLALLDLELHPLILLQGAEALGFDSAVMGKHIVAAVIGLDKSETLGLIEPLHGASRHIDSF
jgi:hypothetical protein